MPLFSDNQELNRIQLYLEKEIQRVRDEIGQGAGAVAIGGSGSGIGDLVLRGTVLVLTDADGKEYEIDLSPILEKIQDLTLTGDVLQLNTNNRNFMVTFPKRDVIRGFALANKILQLRTDEENYDVDLSRIAGTLSDFSISGRVISLEFDGSVRNVTLPPQNPSGDTIESFERSGNMITIGTDHGSHSVTLPDASGDTILSLNLIEHILQVKTDQGTHSIELPSGGDRINSLTVSQSNNLVLNTDRGNFVAPIPRQGDIIEGLRVVDGYLYLDILGKDSLSVKLPVSTGGESPDEGPDPDTPQVPTGRDVRSFKYALLSENDELVLVEPEDDFITLERISGHLEGLPPGYNNAILSEDGEVLITEDELDTLNL